VTVTMYDEWTHTDPILEGPLSGSNTLFVEIAQAIQKHSKKGVDTNNSFQLFEDAAYFSTKPMVSAVLIQIARKVNPF
jgi:hypothetical protein